MPPFDEYIEEIRGLWDSHWLTNCGMLHRELSASLKEYLAVDNIELFVNGHQALETAIHTLSLKGEVITTPFTFASTTQAIVRNGLVPVFCDIKADDYTLDADKLESLITDRTCAIMPVHVYGNICDTEAIQRIADKHGLKVIYDAAHAFGETVSGKAAVSFGDVSMISFHATKVFHTIEGGALVYGDGGLTSKLAALRNFGMVAEDDVPELGGNSKMNEFCAAMGICNLRHINEIIEQRRIVYEIYTDRLSNVSGIKLSAVRSDVRSNYAYFPIMIDPDVFGCSRDEVFEKLAANGITARRYFYPLTSSFKCYNGSFPIQDTPVAKKVSDNILTLPLFSGMTAEQAGYVSDSLLSFKA